MVCSLNFRHKLIDFKPDLLARSWEDVAGPALVELELKLRQENFLEGRENAFRILIVGSINHKEEKYAKSKIRFL